MKIVHNEDVLVAGIMEQSIKDYENLYPCSLEELTDKQKKIFELIHKKEPDFTTFEILETMYKLKYSRKHRYDFKPTPGFHRCYEFYKIREWIDQDWIYFMMDVEYTGKDVLSIVDERCERKLKHG